MFNYYTPCTSLFNSLHHSKAFHSFPAINWWHQKLIYFFSIYGNKLPWETLPHFQTCIHPATIQKSKCNFILIPSPHLYSSLHRLIGRACSHGYCFGSASPPQPSRDPALQVPLLLPPALQNVQNFLIVDLGRTQTKQKLFCSLL